MSPVYPGKLVIKDPNKEIVGHMNIVGTGMYLSFKQKPSKFKLFWYKVLLNWIWKDVDKVK